MKVTAQLTGDRFAGQATRHKSTISGELSE